MGTPSLVDRVAAEEAAGSGSDRAGGKDDVGAPHALAVTTSLPPGGRMPPMCTSRSVRTLASHVSAPRKAGRDARSFREASFLRAALAFGARSRAWAPPRSSIELLAVEAGSGSDRTGSTDVVGNPDTFTITPSLPPGDRMSPMSTSRTPQTSALWCSVQGKADRKSALSVKRPANCHPATGCRQ
jgi:hypothetical protein